MYVSVAKLLVNNKGWLREYIVHLSEKWRISVIRERDRRAGRGPDGAR